MPAPKKEKLDKAINQLVDVYKDIYNYHSFTFPYQNKTITANIKVRVNHIANKPPLYLLTSDYKYISSLFLKEDNTFYFDYKLGDNPSSIYDVTLSKDGIEVEYKK